jgi:hypothetical protein
VNFPKAPCPLGIVADPLIRERMKVSMPTILAAPEDDTGNFSIRTLIEKSMNSREPLITKAQLSPQTEATGEIANRLLISPHAPYNRRI